MSDDIAASLRKMRDNQREALQLQREQVGPTWGNSIAPNASTGGPKPCRRAPGG
ncbi:MAG: hypothetical protein ACJ8GK_13325 [Luteimonas sp.]